MFQETANRLHQRQFFPAIFVLNVRSITEIDAILVYRKQVVVWRCCR